MTAAAADFLLDWPELLPELRNLVRRRMDKLDLVHLSYSCRDERRTCRTLIEWMCDWTKMGPYIRNKIRDHLCPSARILVSMANVKEHAIYDHFDRHQERHMKPLREALHLDDCPRLLAMMPVPPSLPTPPAPQPLIPTTPGLHIIRPIYPTGHRVINASVDLTRLRELQTRAAATLVPALTPDQ